MFKHMDFIIYCIEEFRVTNRMTGRQVINIFNKYNVYGFIEDSYNALHTFGSDNIVWNLKDYNAAKQTNEKN
jgi:hypothetical protein